jgi:hypothetical protein
MSRSETSLAHGRTTERARWAGSVVALVVSVMVSLPTEVSAATEPLRVSVAGDIADGTHLFRARATARLLGPADVVLTTGDNAYPNGTRWDFSAFYDPTWGASLHKTRPTPGNHEYHTQGASGYFDYFGWRAGPRGRGYYTFVRHGWRFVALNSEIGIGWGSAQLAWLRNLLRSTRDRCTIAYWHEPRYSTGPHGNNAFIEPVFRTLYADRVDVVINGHDHSYQRWHPLTGAGSRASNGVQGFVVGTGGGPLTGFERNDARVAERRSTTGVLELSLSATSYAWRFRDASGSVRDRGTRACV